MTTGKSAGELHTAIIRSAEFPCKFPFFWIIKDEIDSKWETAKATGEIYALKIIHIYAAVCMIPMDKLDYYNFI